MSWVVKNKIIQEMMIGGVSRPVVCKTSVRAPLLCPEALLCSLNNAALLRFAISGAILRCCSG